MHQCPICHSDSLTNLHSADSLPLFQNKIYSTESTAKIQPTGTIQLCQCLSCGFVFNATFDASLMDYNEEYQNEQNYSSAFRTHLNQICHFLENSGFKEKNIIEIGCGKGYFLELLEHKGFCNLHGFDPAYEGKNPKIIKDYFSPTYQFLDTDLIILRHVLEHINNPFEFLLSLQRTCKKGTKILIEVPDFEWITSQKAFWDIYYEHCNYFDSYFLSSFFKNANIQKIFGGQYLLILADLDTLQKPFSNHHYPKEMFDANLKRIAEFLDTHPKSILWGASSKGVTLLNLLDKDKKLIDFCIDINPKKQNFFIATTGHQIQSPEVLNVLTTEQRSIIITNQNYYDEIVQNYQNQNNLTFYTIEGLIR